MGESLEEALTREVIEEGDAEIEIIKPLGLQKVSDPYNPDPSRRTYYQVRYVCKLEKLLDLTPEPDAGLIWQRKLVCLVK